MKKLMLLYTLLLINILSSPSFAQVQCKNILTEHLEKQPFEINYHKSGKIFVYRAPFVNTVPLKSQIRIGTYNMKNFTDLNLHPDLNTEKEIARRASQAELLKEINADFQILTEVETAGALHHFIQNNLGNKYVPMLIHGNDPGMNIALLVRSDAAVEVHWKSYAGILNENIQDKPVFTRDLPVGIVFELNKIGNPKTKPKFIIIGTHYKSQIPSEEAINFTPIIRAQQIEATIQIIQKNQKIYGKDVPIIIAGDFNENILLKGSDLQPLFDFGFRDSFNLTKDFLPQHRRYTHLSFLPDGSPKKTQIDGVLLYQNDPAINVLKAKVIAHREKNGNNLGHPLNMQQRNELPSDHLGVLSILQFPEHQTNVQQENN